MEYFNAFWVGGAICLVGQLLIDLTKLTPARIMVTYVTAGVFLGALGLYGPVVDYAGAGATVPLCGFGWALSEGVRKAVIEQGFLGVFTGGLTAGAAGTTAAVFFGYLAALVAKPRDKSYRKSLRGCRRLFSVQEHKASTAVGSPPPGTAHTSPLWTAPRHRQCRYPSAAPGLCCRR